MKFGTYILNSPNYISRADLESFPVWAEWNDPEEIPYIKSICTSEEEYEEVIIAPYKEGKETYYPVIVDGSLPEIEFLFILVDVELLGKRHEKGYVTTVNDEIIAITMWLGNKEIILYREDRLVADDENPSAILAIKKYFGATVPPTVSFCSPFTLSNGNNVVGTFRWNKT